MKQTFNEKLSETNCNFDFKRTQLIRNEFNKKNV